MYPFDPLARLKIRACRGSTANHSPKMRRTASCKPGIPRTNPVRDRALLLMLLDTGCRLASCALRRSTTSTSRLVRFCSTAPRMVSRARSNSAFRADATAGQRWLPSAPGSKSVKLARVSMRCSPHRERWPLSTRRAREIFTELGQVARVSDCHPHRCRHAQPLHAPVLTPTGWRPIGTLRVGDEVIGSDGRPTVVIGVYPRDRKRLSALVSQTARWPKHA